MKKGPEGATILHTFTTKMFQENFGVFLARLDNLRCILKALGKNVGKLVNSKQTNGATPLLLLCRQEDVSDNARLSHPAVRYVFCLLENTASSMLYPFSFGMCGNVLSSPPYEMSTVKTNTLREESVH